jgi:ATP synthase protein I
VPEDNQSGNRNPWVVVGRYSELGFIIPAAVFLGFLIGKLLDYWLHTTWIYIVGVIIGAVLGFIEMIRMATASFKNRS